jgi:hypothetical protein
LQITEWQKVPEVWDVVRRAVAPDSAVGQFLLTGSASPQPGATAHSGAGRIGRLRMRPITLSERGVAQPRVSLAELLSGSRPALDGACTLPLADYAHEIRYAATPGYADKPARGTAIPYRDVLASLWLLDPVHAWMPTESLMTRLGQTPKHHLAEPALVGLLGLTRDALLD